MAEQRRKLVEGLSIAGGDQRKREEAFVFGAPATANESPALTPEPSQPPEPAPPPTPSASKDILPQFLSRAPLTTRVRPEIASALKRASLTRQLQGQEPFHVQEIMEEALETWLRTHSHI